MLKKQKIKSLTNKEQINREIKFLKENNIFHKYIISNYTTTIETDARIIKFNDNMMSKKAFIAYRMILRDLKEYTANEKPDINREELRYFETYIEKTIYCNTAYLVDIKSAYATILYNDGFICKATFDFINILPKKARLAAVGMLASRKDVFYYQGKELTGHEKIINENENYFWYCVKRTSEIMNLICAETKPLFFWVDGIYLKTEKEVQKAHEVLSAEKYNFSTKKIFSFLCKMYETENNNVLNQISFFQSATVTDYSELNKSNSEYKTFSIPVKNLKKELLIKYLSKK